MITIPTHQSEKTLRKEIIVNRLSKLNDYDFSEPHRHEYFELFFFEKGGGVHRIDFREYPIKDHAIHIVAPGQVHQVNRSLDSNGFVCLFETDAVQAMPEINAFLMDHICFDIDSISPAYSFSSEQKDQLKVLTARMEQLIDGHIAMHQLQVRHLVQGMCLECMLVLGNTERAIQPGSYADFRRLLFQHFRKLKKVKDYADLLCITEKTLNEQVRKHIGKSTSEVIYDQIILEAKRLLLLGLSAKETAYDLGFEDPAHFSKFFKKQVGESPSTFRIVQG